GTAGGGRPPPPRRAPAGAPGPPPPAPPPHPALDRLLLLMAGVDLGRHGRSTPCVDTGGWIPSLCKGI
ncbi:hypothetical protein EKT70_00575, partial [Stenotrophomonas geniculata]